ncbi:plasmid mobilization protein [Crateriforma conspicua]|uniref:Bacterial mobilisation domain-containing protein n=1 Tax=Crateriforma conspicua TaxID=2527996 RepID=A0A5C6FHG8_9PLAN|nr:hypothetical protein [Crateriforma conspicua]TWU59619.1 hypothetical protein V7x_55290 [Crateriforma conspicua]
MKVENQEAKPLRLARQPCPEHEIRNRPLRAFLNEIEETKLNSDAEARRMNRHDYLRKLIMEQVTTVVYRGHQADPQLLNDLNGLANNLNQIAMYHHIDSPRRQRIDAILEQIEEVILQLLFGPVVEEEREGVH